MDRVEKKFSPEYPIVRDYVLKAFEDERVQNGVQGLRPNHRRLARFVSGFIEVYSLPTRSEEQTQSIIDLEERAKRAGYSGQAISWMRGKADELMPGWMMAKGTAKIITSVNS